MFYFKLHNSSEHKFYFLINQNFARKVLTNYENLFVESQSYAWFPRKSDKSHHI